ncbi:SusC/RagA family TonB-linked outer membrane protein [Butyricimonas sp. NSJ-56]|uniref:SusC/RagA family TonB-linked outer membrane protein n=2 Tax=Butyricimonas hominis TaxID=2763032 RepID=A0ABR7D0U8_9BACT|nr:SusC/RagA family TonB-linked outer membrane protein [Butyricimonas hominis]
MKKNEMHDLSWRERLLKTCLIMKFVVLLLFVSTLHLSASVYSQEARVTIHLQDASFEDVVKVLENSTNFTFLYRDHQVAQIKNLNLQYTEADIKVVLDACLKGSGLMYRLVDNTIVIQPVYTAVTDSIAKITVKGIVKDEKGEILPGVTIRVKGTTIGFVTNAKGEFDFDLPKRDSLELIFSFVGFKRHNVFVKDGMKPLTVVMKEDLQTVDEVVVTGIFNKPKESFTGAVTSVSKEEFRATYSRNLVQTLSILDPSIRILQNNNAGSNPNALPEIQLRGPATLVDIRDVQSSSRAELNLPLFILDGFEVSLQRVMDLNDDDVENITVLKDASATALYGSRGANGVIVITSAKPIPGKVTVKYRGSLRLELVDLSTYDRLSGREKLELEEKIGVWDDYKETDAYKGIRAAVDNGENYDWLKVPTRNGVGQNHVLTIMGGDEIWKFAASLSYDEKIGVMKGSERNNFNGSLHITYTSDKFTVDEVLSVGVNTNSDSPYGSFSEYAQMNRYWNPYNEDGTPVYDYSHPLKMSSDGLGVQNPIYDASVGRWNKAEYTNIRNTFSLRYNFKENFYLVGSLGLTRQLDTRNTYTPPSHESFAGKEIDQKGSNYRMDKKDDRWQVRLGVDYTNTFAEKHMVTLNLSGEMEERKSDAVNWAAVGFMNDAVSHPSMALSYPAEGMPGGSETTTRRIGLLFSGNYYYDMRFFLDASIRVDGSSSFGKESRYAPFFSVGGGWTVTNERFMYGCSNVINNLKLRGSYGVSGNMGFSPEEALATYKLETNVSYLSGMGAYLQTFGNPELKWQNTHQWNVGVDLGLWNDLLQFQLNYYTKRTNNTVSEMMLPISHGVEMCKANIGVIRNEGYELNVTANIIRDLEREFTWNVTGRFSRNINTVVKLSDTYREAQLQYDNQKMSGHETFYKYQEGRSMDAIYGLRTIGVDPLTGKRLYLTHDGQVTLRQRMVDMVYLGESQPKVNGTISTSLLYKGITLNVGFAVRLGGKQFNSTLLARTENADFLYNLDRRILNGCWEKPGDYALFTKMDPSPYRDYTNVCDMFVQRDNVLQCTNINVGYQFPKVFTKKYLGMESLTVSANLSDIFYISTIKRERGIDYPFSRNPNFSISCSF